jgi:hypothetical protein
MPVNTLSEDILMKMLFEYWVKLNKKGKIPIEPFSNCFLCCLFS